jgi:hypothetical protein
MRPASTIGIGARSSTVIAPAPPEVDHDLRTLVTIARTNPRDFGQRQVIVRIDGGPKITLLYGQSITVELKPGRHTLRAHNTLFIRSITFHLEAGEHIEFMVINYGRPWTYSMVALLGSAPLFLKVIKRSLA